MRIHALQTGSVQVKKSFLFPGSGVRRQLDLLLPGPFSGPLPIHCWAVEHGGRLLLVDSGETPRRATSRSPASRSAPGRNSPARSRRRACRPGDIAEVVLTHHHGDHVDGLVHVRAPVRIKRAELEFLRAPFSSVMRRVLRQPLPPGFAPEPFELDGGPFGAFPSSRALSRTGGSSPWGPPGTHRGTSR